MDIVTHGMMGVILSSPFFAQHPVAATAFAFGCVLPDLDAFSRCFGKRAFLALHEGARMRLFRVDALTGAVTPEGEQELLDARYREALEQVPEFHVMRGLSPAYHVVSAEEEQGRTTLTCRDLRVRNFETTFGRLDLVVGPGDKVEQVTFHV